MYAKYFNGCCGVGEMSGISGIGSQEQAEKAIEDFFKSHIKVTFVIYTEAQLDARADGYGGILRETIKKLDLGHVSATPGWHENVYHGPNKIKVYTWRVDWPKLRTWAEKRGAKPVDLKNYFAHRERPV